MAKNKNKRNIKINKTVMQLSTIIAIIIIGITLYFVFIGKNGKAINNNKFTSVMKEYGLEIHDATDQFGEDYVKSATVAYNKKTYYQIEFIIFSNIESAKNAFLLNKTTFEKTKTETDKEVSNSNEKFSKYALTTNDKYMYISRRENTLIYLVVDGSYKIEVANLIAKIGY